MDFEMTFVDNKSSKTVSLPDQLSHKIGRKFRRVINARVTKQGGEAHFVIEDGGLLLERLEAVVCEELLNSHLSADEQDTVTDESVQKVLEYYYAQMENKVKKKTS